MKTEQLLHQLTTEVSQPRGETITLKKEDAKLLLSRVNFLEGIAAELLRVHKEAGNTVPVILPYQEKP